MFAMRLSVMRQATGLLVMVFGLLISAGCETVPKEEYEALYAENTQLREQLSSQEQSMRDAESDRARLISEVGELRSQLADCRASATATQAAPAQPRQQQLEDIQGVSVTQGTETINVRVPGDILFASGQASLKPASRNTLQQVARILQRDYANNTIRIEGHTDSDPIRKSDWRDNYHLSEARAIAVRDYLASQGVSRARMSIVAMGPDSPVASNSTSAGKAQNRRVEIVVVR